MHWAEQHQWLVWFLKTSSARFRLCKIKPWGGPALDLMLPERQGVWNNGSVSNPRLVSIEMDQTWAGARFGKVLSVWFLVCISKSDSVFNSCSISVLLPSSPPEYLSTTGPLTASFLRCTIHTGHTGTLLWGTCWHTVWVETTEYITDTINLFLAHQNSSFSEWPVFCNPARTLTAKERASVSAGFDWAHATQVRSCSTSRLLTSSTPREPVEPSVMSLTEHSRQGSLRFRLHPRLYVN